MAAGAIALAGLWSAWRVRGREKWLGPSSLLVAGVLIYALNFKLSADRMFLEPASVSMKPVGQNSVEPNRLVVGVEINGDARA